MYALRLLTADELDSVVGGLSPVPPKPGDSMWIYDNDGDGQLSAGDTIIGYTTADGTNYSPEGYAGLLAAEAASQDQDYSYWEFGYSLGIGFGLYGTDEGLGISWNTGIGFYGEIGTADSAEEAADQVGEDQVVIGVDPPSTPEITIDENGDVDEGSIGGGIGIYSTDSDPISPYEPQL